MSKCDIHGNVTTLLQDFPELGTIQEDQRYKRMDYRYDLIAGNVHQVSYQAGKPDQWYHRYEYDADNRITAAFTSRYGWEGDTTGTNLFMDQDVPFWENDATYRYYLHGPLARVETGDIAVQGTDDAYTLQGWLKGVNSNPLSPHRNIEQLNTCCTARSDNQRAMYLCYYVVIFYPHPAQFSRSRLRYCIASAR